MGGLRLSVRGRRDSFAARLCLRRFWDIRRCRFLLYRAALTALLSSTQVSKLARLRVARRFSWHSVSSVAVKQDGMALDYRADGSPESDYGVLAAPSPRITVAYAAIRLCGLALKTRLSCEVLAAVPACLTECCIIAPLA